MKVTEEDRGIIIVRAKDNISKLRQLNRQERKVLDLVVRRKSLSKSEQTIFNSFLTGDRFKLPREDGHRKFRLFEKIQKIGMISSAKLCKNIIKAYKEILPPVSASNAAIRAELNKHFPPAKAKK